MVCPIPYGDHKYSQTRLLFLREINTLICQPTALPRCQYCWLHNIISTSNLTPIQFVPGFPKNVHLSLFPQSLILSIYCSLSVSSTPLFMAALCNTAGHYIFALWFLSFFFSSPNLTGRRLDVYHTSKYMMWP